MKRTKSSVSRTSQLQCGRAGPEKKINGGHRSSTFGTVGPNTTSTFQKADCQLGAPRLVWRATSFGGYRSSGPRAAQGARLSGRLPVGARRAHPRSCAMCAPLVHAPKGGTGATRRRAPRYMARAPPESAQGALPPDGRRSARCGRGGAGRQRAEGVPVSRGTWARAPTCSHALGGARRWDAPGL